MLFDDLDLAIPNRCCSPSHSGARKPPLRPDVSPLPLPLPLPAAVPGLRGRLPAGGGGWW
jgi:hypothetical protein